MDNPNTQATFGTRQRTKKNSTYNTTQHNTKYLNDDKYGPHAKNQGCTHMLVKGKYQFLFFIRRPTRS
jgi:hypothetical protein